MGELKPGEELYSVAAGDLPLAPWKLRPIGGFLKTLDGFRAMHPVPTGGTLLFFDAEQNAKVARNRLEAEGNGCGRNICKWNVANDGVPEFDEEWARERGME